MSRRRLLARVAILLAVVALPSAAEANSAMPLAGHTWAPAEMNCTMMGCHSGTVNDAAGRITARLLNGAAPFTQYEAGLTYVLTFEMESGRTDRLRWGFELTCLTTTTGTAAGTLSASDPLLTRLQTGGGRQYISHGSDRTNDGTFRTDPGPVSWSFQWVAPSGVAAPNVTFYYCCNAANNSGSNSGDYIACATFPVTVTTVPLDTDGDTLVDTDEAGRGTSPTDADTDDDGLSDGAEVNGAIASDPLDCDTDDDGLSDGFEEGVTMPVVPGTDTGPGGCFVPDPTPARTTDPLDCDSDGDGLTDGLEEGVTSPLSDTDVGPAGCFVADADAQTTDPRSNDSDGDSPDGILCLDGTEDGDRNGAVDAGETDPNIAGDCPAIAGIELRIDARTTSLIGGASPSCGANTTPPMGQWMLTPCSAPRTTGCFPAPTLPPTRTLLLVVDGSGPDLVLPGEAAVGFEPGVLTFYELDGCPIELTIAKVGGAIVIDTR